MATTRLRKAFRYPEDSGDEEHEREELDEEGTLSLLYINTSERALTKPTEQERVVEQLQRQNNQRNSQYSIVFTTLPLLSIMMFVPSMLSWSSILAVRFFSFLSVLSLAGTAYTMRQSSSQLPDGKGKRPAADVERTMLVREVLFFANSALCGLLALVYLFVNSLSPVIWPALYLVPGAMFAISLIALKTMVSVDLSHLENLRYGYKGA